MIKPKSVHIFHVFRLFLFVLVAVALLVARSDTGTALWLPRKTQVLAYASNMTITQLLDTTNDVRVANGKDRLNLNSQLTTSAQLKANDMVDKNYWSHVAPDGTQPWHWFEQAGYAYTIAGENLAYGFNTGAEVTTAWMNSEAHKANIMGDYADIGFGIASSGQYQDGAYTVVVAHYGKPRTATATPATAQSATSSTLTASNTTSSSVTVFSLLRQGKATAVIALSLGLIAIAAAGFGLTHRAILNHAMQNGKSFAIHHPLIDAAVVCASIGIILTTVVGYLL